MRQRRADKQKLAEADFTEALRLDPKLMLAYVSRALAREALGDLHGGIKDLSTYLQVKENSSQALLIRSRLHHKLGDSHLGEADLYEALKREPSTVDDWVSRALARLPTDKEGALSDLAIAAELEPTSIRVLQNKAHVLSEHFGRSDEAIECLSGVLNLAPASEKALLGRAVLHAREGNEDAALADLDEAKRRIPRLTPASVYQAACVHALLARHAPERDASHDVTQLRRSALRWLSQAIQRGYGGPLLRDDPDLQALHGDPAFESLVQTVRIGGKR
jgi:tetratricopeptide (TPR) repeat protein